MKSMVSSRLNLLLLNYVGFSHETADALRDGVARSGTMIFAVKIVEVPLIRTL